jgi:hypothetical protein
MPPASTVPMRDRSTAPMSAILYSLIFLVLAKMASVIFSGAGPPLPILYLMPKSSCGRQDCGWPTARDRQRPCICDDVRSGRRRQNAVLADDHLAEAVGGGHGNRLLDHFEIE